MRNKLPRFEGICTCGGLLSNQNMTHEVPNGHSRVIRVDLSRCAVYSAIAGLGTRIAPGCVLSTPSALKLK